MLRLTTFGGLALARDGVALTGAAAQRSRLSLLALLATAGPTGFSRDKLLLYLWPESDEERARHALKQSVYSLRRELGADEVIVGTASLSLNPVFISSDAREFEAAVAAGDLATAVSLYTGPFLDGFHLKDSTEFERWSGELRSRFADMWRNAVERVAADHVTRGEHREAAGYFRKLVTAEPLSGPHTMELMRALAESGDVGAALAQFKIHEALLREELEAAPEPAVAQLADQLKSGTWVRSPVVERVAGRGLRVADAPATADAGLDQQPAARNPQPVSIGAARKRRRLSTALAFVLGGLLTLTAAAATIKYASLDPDARAALKVFRTRPAAKLDPRQIVVAAFENKTNDSTLDVLGEQIADWFSRELSEADFRVVDVRTARIGSKVVGDIPRPLRPDDAVALGEETGSSYTVVGKYYRAGDSLEANINIVDVPSRRTIKSLGPFRWSPRNSGDYIVKLLQPTIAYLAAEVDTTAGGQTIKYTLPGSLEAYRRLSKAWFHFLRSPRDTASVFAELDSAIRLDPTQVTPLVMKAYVYDVKAQWAPMSVLVERARPMIGRMSKTERAAMDLLESDMRGDGVGRPAIARRLQAVSPGAVEMPILRVVSALYIGNLTEATAALAEADPTHGMNLGTPTYVEWAAVVYHETGQVALEERTVREELKRFRHHPPATYGLVRVYAARNDTGLGELIAKGIPPAQDPTDPRDPVTESVELPLFAGRELRAHGHATEARRIFAGVVERFQHWDTRDRLREHALLEARAYYELGDYQKARELYGLLAAQPDNFEAMARVATASIHLGDLKTAKEMDERLSKVQRPFLMGAVPRWRAAIAAAQGKTGDAISLLETAIRQGHRLMDSPPNLTVHLDLDLMGIEKQPGYRAMLQALTDASASK